MTSLLRHDGLAGRWSSPLPGSHSLVGQRWSDVYGTSMGGRLAQRLMPATRTWCAPWALAWGSFVERVTRIELAL
ncbi:hypothetical protein ACFC3O_20915 [Streptomyces sp. NPDC056007]|uniref:hypothetical protein n=1 Tax=Streptomyces sp. NPDC056007 TaxID=3345678 RepID=UPI0035E21155